MYLLCSSRDETLTLLDLRTNDALHIYRFIFFKNFNFLIVFEIIYIFAIYVILNYFFEPGFFK